MKEKVFVSAYACEPGLGSEIGVGWHWVLEMSKQFELWVLTRESNRHTIEPWIAEHPEFAGIHFLYFDLPKWARFWKKGLRGVRTYYNIWQRLTDKIVKRTMHKEGIKVFHHITYGNALWPVSDYGSRQTFIWGPIGGLETIPEDYTRHYDFKSRMTESLRRKVVGRAIKSRGLRERCERADLILCKTEDTLGKLPETAQGKAILFTDVATDVVQEEKGAPMAPHPGLRLLTVGRLDAWRGFDLAILAVAKALTDYPDIQLDIVGKGADRERLEELVRTQGMEGHVTFHGGVSQDAYRSLMKQTDVVLNPSLKEGAVTVSFDAMAMGKPLVAVDTGGYTKSFKPEYSIVVPREVREKTIESLAEGILRLTDAKVRKEMGEAAARASETFSWERHGEDICRLVAKTAND